MELREITIYTKDITETKTFYLNTMSFKLIQETENSITFKIGNSQLTFIHTTDDLEIYHYAFNIQPNHLNEAITWSEKRFQLILSPTNNIITTFEQWKAESIYFYDNNGNLLEFIARAESPILTKDSFSSDAVLNISEFGIVSEKAIEKAEELIVTYNFHYFDKAVASNQFLALGDDEGLLIFVEPNRNWYPTRTKAKMSTAKIAIALHDNLIELQSTDLYK